MAETGQDQAGLSPIELSRSAPSDGPHPAFNAMDLLTQYHQVNLTGGKTATQVAQDLITSGLANCPSSPEYTQYIDVASRYIYDPEKLGNVGALEHKFDCNIHSPADVTEYVNQALALTGDKYDNAMSPAEAKKFDKQQRSGYSGIGLVIQAADQLHVSNSPGASIIVKPVPGKAAEKAGLQAGDAFLKIDGQDVHASGPGDISDLITSGKPGTPVDIVVDRNGKTVEKIVTREAIQSPPVVHDKDLGDGVVYLKVDSFFNDSEAAQLAAAIDRHKDAKAFVVDVRGNGGGYVDQALLSASLFMKNGTLMTTRQRDDSPADKPVYENDTYRLTDHSIDTVANGHVKLSISRLPDKVGDRPVVVLTNGGSASASEIFAGAMHDTGHDPIYGTTSFGKGIGQTLFKNMTDHGYLRVTGMHYMTPSGFWPGPGTGPDPAHPEYGIKPDKVIPDPVKGSDVDGQLDAAVDDLKAKLAGK